MAGLYPHEWLFGAYLVIAWSRLTLTQGLFGPDTLAYATGIAIAAALVVADRRHASAASMRWRLVFYPLAMNVYFQQMKSAVPAISPAKADASLRAVDAALFGETPSVLLQAWVTPWLTELMSFFYLLFFPYLLISIVVHFIGPLERCKAFVSGLFSLYGIGFLGYTLVPAAGPWLAFAADFKVPLTGGQLTSWNDALVKLGSSGVDVFPSLHVAVSCFLLGFDFRHKPWRFRLYLLPCVGLWLSTLYLRYHYLIDVLCGLLLAALALSIATRRPSLPEPRR